MKSDKTYFKNTSFKCMPFKIVKNMSHVNRDDCKM